MEVDVGEVVEEGEEAVRGACGEDGEGEQQTWGVVAAGACPPEEEGVFWEVHSSCLGEVPSEAQAASGTSSYIHNMAKSSASCARKGRVCSRSCY